MEQRPCRGWPGECEGLNPERGGAGREEEAGPAGLQRDCRLQVYEQAGAQEVKHPPGGGGCYLDWMWL